MNWEKVGLLLLACIALWAVQEKKFWYYAFNVLTIACVVLFIVSLFTLNIGGLLLFGVGARIFYLLTNWIIRRIQLASESHPQ